MSESVKVADDLPTIGTVAERRQPLSPPGQTMTVLLAFVSPLQHAAFLAGDDLESHQGVQIDKVSTVWRRFAVGFYGLDTLFEAVQFSAYGSQDSDVVRFSTGSAIKPVTDLHTLLERASATLPRLAAKYRRNVARQAEVGEITDAQHQRYLHSGGGLVVLDYEEMRLHHAKLRGAILGEGSRFEFDVQALDPERAFRFAINDPLDLGPVTAEMALKPRRWARPKVVEARLECEAAGFPGTIGELGASFTKRGDETEFFSAYASVDDYMTLHGVPLPGEAVRPTKNK